MQLTMDELKEILAAKSGGGLSHSFEVGKAYLIRTVTLYYTGRIERITDSDLFLADAAWIADTGRFSEALKNGTLNEVEPFRCGVIVPRGGIIDATRWEHALPRDVK